MKATLFFVSLLLSLNGFSQGKKSGDLQHKNQEIKVLSLDKNKIEDDNVQSINVSYAIQKPLFIMVFLKNHTFFNGLEEDNNFYDMNFEGDRFIFAQKYPELIDTTRIRQKCLTRDLKHLNKVSMYKDSTIYYYSDNANHSKDSPPWCLPARYVGDIKDLEQHISMDLQDTKTNSSADSICVFELIISTDGEIKSMNLISENESDLSRSTKKITLLNRYVDNTKSKSQRESKWQTAIRYNTSRPIETKVKMFVRLERDKTIQILLPKIMRNFTGS